MINEPLVSIVIPVYNAEQYIEDNVNSIINQTYHNIEIIYVCDGCTDNTVAILNEYKNDNRIKIVNRKNNLGAAASRNQGGKLASGEWLIFWDADDYVKNNAIEIMLDKAITYNADMAICAYGKIGETIPDSKNMQFDYLKEKIDTYPLWVNNGIVFDLANQIVGNEPFNKLIKREIFELDNVWFQDVKNCNDVYYSVSSFLCAKKIAYIDERLYWYRKNAIGNISSKRLNVRSFILSALQQVRRLILEMKYDESVFKNYAYVEIAAYRDARVYNQIKIEYLEKYDQEWQVPIDYKCRYYFDKLDLIKDKKIVVYGAGNVGKDYYYALKKYSEIVGFLDSNNEYENVKNVKYITEMMYDYVIIATKSDSNAQQMLKTLCDLNVEKDKIVLRYPLNVSCQYLSDMGSTCNKNNDFFVSVIVPVYNVEKYLAKCLDNLIYQTYKYIEIIVIDDGSKDSSGKICDEYAQKDRRIRVLHKSNNGLVAARKDGLRLANGKYITFVDSDDWIEIDAVERLVDKIKEHNCDIVASPYYKQYGENITKERNYVSSGYYDKKALEEKVYPVMMSAEGFFKIGVRATIWGKLLRKDILLKLYKDMSNKIKNGEDAAILYPYLLEADSLYILEDAFYHYRQLPESISQKKKDEGDLLSSKLLFERFDLYFSRYPKSYNLDKQLNEYTAQFLLLNEIEKFDDYKGQLRCFGGLPETGKIAIYAAGKFGKQVYYYLKSCSRDVVWIDKNYEYYQNQGLPVEGIDVLVSKDIEKVLIAVIDEDVSMIIKNSLVQADVDEEKIMCLDIAYITSENTINKRGYRFESSK